MKIKVINKNGLAAYFPESINYKNNVIDTEKKTIDGNPYIEISEEEHQESFGKKMCVIDGVFQEYIKSNSQKLVEEKAIKTAQCLAYLQQTDWYVIREIDQPNSYPKEIKEKRILARDTINNIDKYNTLEELKEIKLIF
jgi:hypothetical protein